MKLINKKNKYLLSPKGIELTPIIVELYLFSRSLTDVNLSIEDNRLIRAFIEDKTDLIELIKKSLIDESQMAFNNNPDLLAETLKKDLLT